MGVAVADEDQGAATDLGMSVVGGGSTHQDTILGKVVDLPISSKLDEFNT